MVSKALIFGLLQTSLFAPFVGAPMQASAAEVRGTVTMDYQGMFTADTSVQSLPVSVALLPAQGQRGVPRRPRRVEIVGNRMSPTFFTVKRRCRISL